METADERGRIRARLGGLFGARAFLLGLAAMGVGAVAGGTTVPIPLVGPSAGLFLGAVALGVLTPRRPLVEAGIAGGLVGVGATVGGSLGLVLIGGLPLVAAGGALGVALGSLGAYFGHDLRDGWKRAARD